MNQLLDMAMALIISPRQALMEITNEEKLKEGFFIWIFVVLLMSLSLFQQGPGLVMQFLLMVLFMGAALLVHSAIIDYIPASGAAWVPPEALRQDSWRLLCPWPFLFSLPF